MMQNTIKLSQVKHLHHLGILLHHGLFPRGKGGQRMVPAVLPAGLPHGELGALTSSLVPDVYVIVQHLGLSFAQHNHVDVAGSGCL